MSKYQPLSDRLSGHDQPEWRATFTEIETVLGCPLPKGARAKSTWWANDGESGHSRAWSSAGWEVAEVDRDVGAVVFRRSAQPSLGDPDAPRPEQGAGRATIDLPPPPTGAARTQPEAMRRASDSASRGFRARRSGPLLAGVAVAAGVAAVIARQVMRRRA